MRKHLNLKLVKSEKLITSKEKTKLSSKEQLESSNENPLVGLNFINFLK